MAGIVDGDAFFSGKLVRFGYVTLTPNKDCFLLKKGENIKAHEFHYWDSTENGNLFFAEKPKKNVCFNCMYEYKNFIGGYPHIFYYSNMNFAENFIKRCGEWKNL